MKNHLGSYECKLCLTLHNNEVKILIAFSLIPPTEQVLGQSQRRTYFFVHCFDTDNLYALII